MRKLLAVAAVCLVLPLGVSAGMKPGQWEVTSKVDLGKNMPQIPQLTPQQIEQMRQLGIELPSIGPGGAISMQTCVSQKDAENGYPPMDERVQRDCKVQDLKRNGKRTTLKVVCNGEMQGTGDVEFIENSPEHYSSKFHLVGTTHGRSIDMNNSAEGRWLGPTCK
ncbi:DUF3617 domain-containing protein [Stenotrophobium rhamnosiphilum]|uniref:DUF3617 domain-containing protein n=1 Tax=Stenotrophobium rhamnosiphilum TaxID=2029166 RepID=A0A2T5MFU0_9GAMM|nr:DUF3617 domain-containing protein [Stenotrophobium rhamnosiphilum]PTU31426.1 hypothetical protein CJD38_08780 [Stenotrophobium rhamnosiphilum]